MEWDGRYEVSCWCTLHTAGEGGKGCVTLTQFVGGEDLRIFGGEGGAKTRVKIEGTYF